MKFRTDPKILAAIAHHLLLPGRSPVPEFYGVRLIADGAGCRAQTYNLDMFAEASFEAEVLAHGEAIVPNAKFAKVVASCPGATLIEASDKLSIRSGDYRVTMATFRPDGWGTLPSMGDGMEDVASIGTAELAHMLATPSILAAHVTDRANIEGVLMEVGDDITVVGTDGKALSTSSLERGKGEHAPVFIPSDGVRKLLAILPLMGEEASLYVDGRMLWVVGDGCTMAITCPDNGYPNYRQLLARRDTTWKGNIHGQDLVPVVKRAMLACGQEPLIQLTLGEDIKVGASTREIEFEESVEAHGVEGCDLVKVRGDRLLECLPDADLSIEAGEGQMFISDGYIKNVVVVSRS
jgi:DNA polymerase III sliding clamp (beta) subunit (PCNA family)